MSQVKIIFQMDKKWLDELKKEEYFGCENINQYVQELLIENPDLIFNAEIKVEVQ